MIRWMALAALVGCSTPPVTGSVSDGLFNSPMPGVKVLAQATGDSSLTCRAFEGEVGEDGKYSLNGLCSGVEYQLSIQDEALWVPEAPKVAGSDGGNFDIKAWRLSKGPGVYKLATDISEPLKSHGDLKKEKIKESDKEALYPAKLPKKAHVVEAGQYLVLNGRYAGEAIIKPLIPTGTRIFGDDEVKVTMQPWAYIGQTFSSDTAMTEVDAKIDDTKIQKMESGERKAWFIPADAIAPGRYAIYVPENRARVTIVDMGGAVTDFELPKE